MLHLTEFVIILLRNCVCVILTVSENPMHSDSALSTLYLRVICVDEALEIMKFL